MCLEGSYSAWVCCDVASVYMVANMSRNRDKTGCVDQGEEIREVDSKDVLVWRDSCRTVPAAKVEVESRY